jgi:hypothetical protein
MLELDIDVFARSKAAEDDDGMQQGLGDGELLQVSFIFSSNGDRLEESIESGKDKQTDSLNALMSQV